MPKQQSQQTPQRFYKLLEAGDLAFLKLIQYAMVVIGITKHGKTTLSHHLVNHPLEAYENQRKEIHYRLALQKDKNNIAKIGDRMQSETEIPNSFQTDIKIKDGENLFLIDNPGQQDSFGINRILSNAYFYYRVFSKCQNMKFIIVFDYWMFSAGQDETNEIFKAFFDNFKNLRQVRKRLINSIAIIFTKVDASIPMQDIKSTIRKYIQAIQKNKILDEQKLHFIEELFHECQSKQKIRLFKQAKLGVQVQTCTFLKQLNQKLQFFTRQLQPETKITSRYYKQQCVSVRQIKFSESNKIKQLNNQQVQKKRIEEVFHQLSKRGNVIFTQLLQVLEKLYSFLLFQYETVEINQSLSQTKRSTRSQKLGQIISRLQILSISYDDSQKYSKKREEIIKEYAKHLKSTPKCTTFFERLQIISEIQKFLLAYSQMELLKDRNKEAIIKLKIDFENIIMKISQSYHYNKDIQILAHYLYDLNTFMNQLIIFILIIFPSRDTAESIKSFNQFLKDQTLGMFCNSLDHLLRTAAQKTDLVTSKLSKQFQIEREIVNGLQINLFIKYYLQKFPHVILSQNEHQEEILLKLSTIQLDPEYRIQCIMLTFAFLKKKVLLLTNFKTINQQEIDQNQIPLNYKTDDVKKLLVSLILFLTQLKKVKELVQKKDFAKYKQTTDEVNFLAWTYIVRFLYILMQIDQHPPKQAPKKINDQKINSTQMLTISQLANYQSEQQIGNFYKSTIFQIFASWKNYSLIQEVFNQLYTKQRILLQKVTLETVKQKLNDKSINPLKGFEPECFKSFEEERRKHAEIIIKDLLQKANLLKQMSLKEKALTQCYKALKYVEDCHDYLHKIEQTADEIRRTSGKQLPFGRYQKKSISQFQTSIPTRKKLTKFLKANQKCLPFQCVKHSFLE